jgi:Flp pilus assembly protein protease CpaA
MFESVNFILDNAGITTDGKALAVYGIILAACLGHASYTDWFEGRLVSNVTSLVLICSSFAVAPFIWEDPTKMILVSLGWIFILTIFFLMGWVGGGDWKIYIALAPILGFANIVMFVIAAILSLVSVLFALDYAKETKSDKNGMRFGKVPACPAISLATIITIGLIGCPLIFTIGLFGLTILFAALTPVYQNLHRKAVLAEMAEESKANPNVWPQDFLDQQ